MEIKKEHINELLKKENVIGVGMGKKVVKGRVTKKDCITILVSKKKKLDSLSKANIVPETIEGMQTDVIETGIIRILPKHSKHVSKQSSHHTSRTRPAVGGISIGHIDITAGTLGCIVYRNSQPYILSNNHVLANSNNAQLGDPILQPGPYDGGTIEDKIATLEQFVEVKFEIDLPDCNIANTALKVLNFFTRIFKPRYKWHLTKQTSHVNYVDAAIAKPLSNSLVKDEILEIGQIKGVATAELDMEVQKSGRTTGYTTDKIQVVDTTVRVQYGVGKIALFEGQIIAGPMSQGGDSGSAVLDMDNNLIGLLFAGSDQVTVFSPIQKVFELLNVGR